MKKYILTFSVAYIIAMLAVLVIESFFEMPSTTSVICLIVGSFSAAARFVKEHQRIPDAAEKKSLVRGCLLASIIISIIATAISIVIFPETLPYLKMAMTQLPIWIWLIAITFTLLIHYLVLALSFGWMAKRFLPKSAT
ncbi:hypothetical protein B9T33_14410 [Acinetobacter sp. ANC 5054]|uniref:ABZJ_00895 family protein n=1 Tax=Acinetobacter sp. ANC 5054 TaxID=1977877 RepID=UPI000A34B679|nr:ABZJ_00895 family protein [Acinetobacter sp. ANC 5054]OTG77984.1 hypothetical protein B9T33_14410 [Acinetobacter sp. ANC 5054]